jgi:hypothetical protein
MAAPLPAPGFPAGFPLACGRRAALPRLPPGARRGPRRTAAPGPAGGLGQFPAGGVPWSLPVRSVSRVGRASSGSLRPVLPGAGRAGRLTVGGWPAWACCGRSRCHRPGPAVSAARSSSRPVGVSSATAGTAAASQATAGVVGPAAGQVRRPPPERGFYMETQVDKGPCPHCDLTLKTCPACWAAGYRGEAPCACRETKKGHDNG